MYLNRRRKEETTSERVGDPKKRKADPTDDLEKDPFEGYGEDCQYARRQRFCRLDRGFSQHDITQNAGLWTNVYSVQIYIERPTWGV